ncbi:MAG: hypothetical protein LKF47_02395 [Megasphaera sp.]|jgi:hypothetical protein|nr:hypothetical protein [Megasphaera sp.]MCI1247451.1 hypothetical protein [Megasphaera sp.]
MKCKYIPVVAMAAVLGLSACPAAAFDYTLSVDEISGSSLTAYDTVYLGMPRGDFDANFSVLTDWKFYGNTTDTIEKAERSVTDENGTVTEGILIATDTPAADAKVLAFDNYFKTGNRKIAKAIYTRLVATVYSNMESFPASQNGTAVTWIQDDVTIVCYYDGKKDSDGNYIVYIRRYNNHRLNE